MQRKVDCVFALMTKDYRKSNHNFEHVERVTVLDFYNSLTLCVTLDGNCILHFLESVAPLHGESAKSITAYTVCD